MMKWYLLLILWVWLLAILMALLGCQRDRRPEKGMSSDVAISDVTADTAIMEITTDQDQEESSVEAERISGEVTTHRYGLSPEWVQLLAGLVPNALAIVLGVVMRAVKVGFALAGAIFGMMLVCLFLDCPIRKATGTGMIVKWSGLGLGAAIIVGSLAAGVYVL
jgi:hypothetical protein